jgi:hypothetical protein
VDIAPVLLTACLPPAVLAAALFFTRKRRMPARLAWAAFWLTVSMPLGIASFFAPMMALTYNPAHEHNPGVGAAAVPIFLSWVACAGLLLAGTMLILVLKLTRTIRTQDQTRA